MLLHGEEWREATAAQPPGRSRVALAEAIQRARLASETEEYYIGQGVAAAILTTYGLYRNQAVTAYVNFVGNTVVTGSPRPYIYGGYPMAVSR